MIAYPGKAGKHYKSQMDISGVSRKSTNVKVATQNCHMDNNLRPEAPALNKRDSSDGVEDYLWLGPRGGGGMMYLFLKNHHRNIFLSYFLNNWVIFL